ncbi:TPA: restriction endonuclease subunit S [Streptococcus suis]|nr:restriction endonuclease subunit S [Streptococcus suis]
MTKKLPHYRFQGYTDAWELRKLGEVSKKISEKNVDNLYSETFTNSAEHGIISQRDFFDKDISNATNLNMYYIVQNNDFVYNPRISNYAPVGPVKRNKLGRTGVMSPLYYVFRTHDIDEGYLETYFDTTYWHSFMKLNGDSGARADRFAIKDSVFAEMPLPIPSLPEQEAIGTFFSTLDQHIALHQRKLDTLKEQKKTYLKLLFPAKGQTKPALRFQGFEDDWKEVKLGEVLSVSKLKNKENEYSKLDVLSVSREQGTVNQIEYQGRSFASDDVSGYKIVKVGQMIYTKSPLKGAPYGIFQTVTINGIVSPLYAVYNSSGRALASFVSLILKEDAIATHYLSPLVTKGAKNTINVTDEGALEGKVKIPTLPEQEVIGTFFSTLDQEIAQVEDKLASLKEMKKTLLRKLFV